VEQQSCKPAEWGHGGPLGWGPGREVISGGLAGLLGRGPVEWRPSGPISRGFGLRGRGPAEQNIGSVGLGGRSLVGRLFF
jgi:hypothetical protein